MTDSVWTSELFPEHKEYFHKICTPTAGKVAMKQIDIIHLKENQIDVQLIFNIFRQTLLLFSGVSTYSPLQEVQRMDTTIGTCCF